MAAAVKDNLTARIVLCEIDTDINDEAFAVAMADALVDHLAGTPAEEGTPRRHADHT